ncbi:hypothetical protein BLA29_010632 [Euroglyphus maynei]|uniref:Cystatin domain-containing protein n=1 Tax=Euroglyphus maynei TaxID=6958 RepID=A0A1Y3ASA9_EURMA|nr:hypothetical protein BLA29_010632 [Euroglyphus maynei]
MAIHRNQKSGGYQKLDIHDGNLQEAVKKVEPQMNENLMYEPHLYRVERVLFAEYQLVAGIMYNTTFIFGETECNKSNAIDHNKSCEINGKRLECNAKIWIRSWDDFCKLMHFQCE